MASFFKLDRGESDRETMGSVDAYDNHDDDDDDVDDDVDDAYEDDNDDGESSVTARDWHLKVIDGKR